MASDSGRATLAAARDAASWTAARLHTFERRLRVLVGIDSGPDAPAGRDEVAGLLAELATQAGASADLVSLPAGAHLRARLEGYGEGRIVLLGHHDTIFPAGTAAGRPLELRDGVAYGPGVADMKGGLLVGLAAIEALAKGERRFGCVELHSVPDEEVRTTPFATLDHVTDADAVLVLECGRENGDLVSGRKTGAWVRMIVEGRPAHAGTEPELGRSAVLGLCSEVLRCSALDGARAGLTVIAGTISGGTIANVVPEYAEAMFDVRAPRKADFDWALAEMARTGGREGLKVRLEDAGAWPGIEQGAPGERLIRAALEIAVELGVSVGHQTSGGMSDGCWTAAAGVPTLDGLGPVGGRDHSPDEYIVMSSVAPRCGILAGLCTAVGGGLLRGPGPDREVSTERKRV